MRQYPTAPSRASMAFTQRMACVDWQSSGTWPTMHGRPLMVHDRVALSHASCGQSVSCRQLQKPSTLVSPVTRHCGTHLSVFGSHTDPVSGGSAFSEASLPSPPALPACGLAGSALHADECASQAEGPADG